MAHHDFRFWRWPHFMISVAIIICAAFLLVPMTAAAKGANKFYEIPVFTGFETLGDSPSYPQEAQYIVYIRNKILRKASYAALEFKSAHAGGSRVVINDRAYSLPETGEFWLDEVSDAENSVIPIPVGILKRGNNTVSFEARYFGPGDKEYDDFSFGEVSLILNQ